MRPFALVLGAGGWGGEASPHARPSSGRLSGVAGEPDAGQGLLGLAGRAMRSAKLEAEAGTLAQLWHPMRCWGPGASHCCPPGTRFALRGAGGAVRGLQRSPAWPGAASRAARSHERLPTLRWPAASSAWVAPLNPQSARGGFGGSQRCCGHPACKKA